MKKTTLVVTSVLALAVAPIFADVAMSGDAEFGASSNFDDTSKFDIDDVDLDIKASVDDYTTAKFDITLDKAYSSAANKYFDSGSNDSADIYGSEFEVYTDATKAFGLEDLPFTVKLTAGYNDNIGAKGYDSKMLLQTADYNGDRDPEIEPTVGMYLTYETFTLQAGVDPLMFTLDSGEKDITGNVPGAFIGVYGTQGPVTAELYFNHNCKKHLGSTGTNEYLDTIGMTSKSMIDMSRVNKDMELTVGFGMTYDMISNWATDSDDYKKYGDDGAGLNISFQPKLAYKQFTTTIAFAYANTIGDFNGVSYDDTLAMSYELSYKFHEKFTFESGIGVTDVINGDYDFYGSDADAAFRIDVASTVGKTVWKFGYQSSSEYCAYFDGVDTDEGVFMSCKVKY